MAALSAVFTISFLFAMNIITIYHYLNKQTYIISDFTSRFNSYCGTNLATPIAFATVILVPVLFIFFFNKKYEKIINELDNNNRNNIYNILAILYQIITILSFITIWIY